MYTDKDKLLFDALRQVLFQWTMIVSARHP